MFIFNRTKMVITKQEDVNSSEENYCGVGVGVGAGAYLTLSGRGDGVGLGVGTYSRLGAY